MEFDVHITGAFLRKVARRRLLRRWPLDLTAGALVVTGIWLGPAGSRWGAGSVFGLTALGFLLLFYGANYLRQRRSIADWTRMQGDAPVHYHLTPESLRATSNLGGSELRWSAFRELMEHPDFLILSLGSSGRLTLPRAEVPPEALAFIHERFASHNLPVKRA